MEDQLQQLQAELQAQLDEQHDTLAAISAALVADAANDDLLQMRQQLEAAAQETELALVQLKRDRLLRQLDAAAGQGTAAAAVTQSGVGPGAQQPASWQAGQQCVFRFSDGRFYLGSIDSVEGETAHLRFCMPTRQHQLAPLQLPTSALSAPRQQHALQASDVAPGTRVILRPPGEQLWVAAEVTAVDSARDSVQAVTGSGSRVGVPLTSVALSATVPSPWEQPGPDGGVSGSEPSSSSGEGSDVSDAEGSASEAGADSLSEEEEEEGVPYGRVSVALSGAAAQVQAAAEAGPQTDTRLFSSWEEHTRGIGSKMLARMGFKGGGLGRSQHGIEAPLEAAQLRRGAGLGAEAEAHATRAGKKRKKRKRGGKTAAQRNASKAAYEQREAQRGRQAELEARTGDEGLFAFLNSKIGDASEAAAVQRAGGGEPEGAGAGPPGKNAHLFARQPAKGANGAAAAAVASKPPDRRALAGQQEHVAQLRQKVGQLQDMAKRNAKDKVMLPQIKRALAEAQQQLHAAEHAHSSAQRDIQEKEKQKKWLKF